LPPAHRPLDPGDDGHAGPVALKVVGAGVGRTGTHSLKAALEDLLGAPCYHMVDVRARPADVAVWYAAVRGEPTDWRSFPAGFVATVDWPAAAFWRELAGAHPEAVVLLSVRDSAAWWRSASRTIFDGARRTPPPDGDPDLPRHEMLLELLSSRFTENWADRDTAIEAYERHNDEVRAEVAPDRLLEWRPEEGWAPICRVLGLAVPDRPFPRLSTTAEFRAQAGLV
jgi:Sulfotransferase domain